MTKHTAMFHPAICDSRGGRLSILMVLLWGALALLLPHHALANGNGTNLQARQQIEDLVVCYALGTDAIGRATDAIGGQPLDSTVNLSAATFSEDFTEGLERYQDCFSDDFTFTLAFDGVPALTVPDPSAGLAADPALQWANFVNNAFRAPGYQNTQHHMGTISIDVSGNSGSAQSYLIATHSYGPTSAKTGVNVVGGTYTDEVVRRQGRWVIRSRTLNITSSVDVPAGL